jgi:integrase
MTSSMTLTLSAELRLSHCGNNGAVTITPPMILKTLRKAEAKGNYETAHRLRARIGWVFRYAVASGVADTHPISAYVFLRRRFSSSSALIWLIIDASIPHATIVLEPMANKVPFRPPFVERRVAHPVLAAQLRDRHTALGLT